ncbi:unnamed protein product [Amaranthus hypochondriacus]
MSSVKSTAWITMAAIENMKEQGFDRWNHSQHANNNIRSYSQPRNLSGSSNSSISQNFGEDLNMNQSEESLRKVMYLSCWGPN